MLHRLLRNFMLMILLIGIVAACSGKTGIDPIMPPTERALAVESGYMVLTLSNGIVSIRTIDFTYDMDFAWDYNDDGLVITNNDPTVYDFSLQHTIIIESEQEFYSAGIIEEGMETAALGIPLVEGDNDFAIYICDEPSYTFLNGDIYSGSYWDEEDIVESPCGLYEYLSNEVCFSFSINTEASERHRIFKEYNLFMVGLIEDSYSSEIHYEARIDDERCPFDVSDALSEEEEVLEPTPHYIATTTTYEPNDPAWLEISKHWAMERIEANRAWDIYETGIEDELGSASVVGKNIVICIADTGVAYDHEDFELDGFRETFYHYYSNDFNRRPPIGPPPNPDPYDYRGHGTNVAGIAAAMGNNSMGLAGMVWDPYIVSVKCLNDKGKSTMSSIAAAINHIGAMAADNPDYRFIGNFSLGSYKDGRAPRNAANYANSFPNTFLVASAGNDEIDKALYPASYHEFVSVAASWYSVNGKDVPTAFTNWHESVDVCAPGEGIYTTGFPGQSSFWYPDSEEGNWYGLFSGTSAAAPHVSGLAALLWAKYPDWTKEEILATIKETADPMYIPQGKEGKLGTGRINAFRALSATRGNLIWADQAGGTNADVGTAITALSDDSIVITGYFEGTATFGGSTNLTSAGGKDIFLARYNPDGQLLGAIRAGGTDDNIAWGLSTIPPGLLLSIDDSVVVTGEFSGTAVFGAGQANETVLVSEGDKDIFIACYNPNDGTLWWANKAGGTGSNRGWAVTTLPNGNIVVTGEFTGTAKFGEGVDEITLTSAGSADIFIACYSSVDGSLLWAKSAGGKERDLGRAITALSDNSVVVAGDFWGEAIFGEGKPNETIMESLGYSDIFIACYNGNGVFEWAIRAGASGYDRCYGISTLSVDSVVVTGYHESSGDMFFYIARVCQNGSFEWIKVASGASSDACGRGIIAIPSNDSSVVTGYYSGEVTFGVGEPNETTLTSAGNEDIFIARYTSDGNLIWVKSAGGSYLDAGLDVTSLSDYSLVTTGLFTGVATFGENEPNETTLSSAGSHDIFISKFEP